MKAQEMLEKLRAAGVPAHAFRNVDRYIGHVPSYCHKVAVYEPDRELTADEVENVRYEVQHDFDLTIE